MSPAGAVTRTEFGRLKIGELDFDSGRGGGSPCPEGFLAEDAECAAGCEMALDGGVNGSEPLRRSGRFEALHLAFAPSHRQTRILNPIVLAQALCMASAQSHFRLCRAIRAPLVGHQHLGREALLLKHPLSSNKVSGQAEVVSHV
jgi:hypothetical protein